MTSGDLDVIINGMREGWIGFAMKKSESKHTSGPWEWRDVTGAGLQVYGPISAGGYVELPLGMPDTVQFFNLASPQNILIAYERWVQFEPKGWHEMQEANARLITAAPDLHQIGVELDRLSLVIESAVRVASTVYWEDVVALIKANRAAIAKATGAAS